MRPGMWATASARSPRVLFWTAAVLGGAATAAVALIPALQFAYHQPSLHLVLETFEACIAMLVGYLLFGRFRQRGYPVDLVLSFALGLLGLTNLVYGAVLPSLDALGGNEHMTWAALGARLIGAVAFAIAPFLPQRRVGNETRWKVVMGESLLLTLLAVSLIAAAAGPYLPGVLDPQMAPEMIVYPQPAGHPVVVVAQLLSMVAYAIAAMGFVRLADRDGDELMWWFAAGTILATWARVNYFLFPSLYSSYVYTGDLLRMGGYFMLATGAVREIRAYWEDLASSAVLQERRRIAYELHDGLAQELAFILSRSRAVQRVPNRADAEQLASAAQRALDESRRAVAVLANADEESLSVMLTKTATQMADRFGMSVLIDVGDDVAAPQLVGEALVRITREAINNAARHGQASNVTVRLEHGDELRLRVSDDGVGFDPEVESVVRSGFGLVSMRERTETLGGRFNVESRPGAGAAVEIALP